MHIKNENNLTLYHNYFISVFKCSELVKWVVGYFNEQYKENHKHVPTPKSMQSSRYFYILQN